MSGNAPQQDALHHTLARLVRAVFLAAALAFVTVTAVKALRAPWQVDDFPESLAIKVELLPVLFPAHMIAGGAALLLVPLAIALSGHPRWHRPVARIAALDVALAGITAFPVALVAPVTPASALGFSAQGLLWLTLLVMGIRAIRCGEVLRHRACMLLMAAATSGAVFFRVWLALWAIWGSPHHFALFYACNAWIAWLLPVAITGLVLQQNTLRRLKA